jgi:hypothetical protein
MKNSTKVLGGILEKSLQLERADSPPRAASPPFIIALLPKLESAVYRNHTYSPAKSVTLGCESVRMLRIEELMLTAPLPNSTFHRFQDKLGNWVSGCVLCLTIVGAAESLEELTTLEDLHECFEKKPPKGVQNL